MLPTQEERAAHAEKVRLGKERARAEREAKAAAAPEEPIEKMPIIPFGDEAVAGPAFEPEPEPEPEPEVREPEPLDAFGRFLAAQEQETIDLLGREELRVIWEAENKKALELKRENTRKAARDRAAQHAKGEAGLIAPADLAAAELKRKMNRKVVYTPDLPELSDVGLRINGRILYHGQPVTITYGEWLSFREIEWRNKNMELDFEGKGRLHHLRRSLVSTNPVRV